MAKAGSLMARLQVNSGLRRSLTVPGVGLGALALAGTSVVWAPVAYAADRLSGRDGSPRLRTLASVLAWTGLETVGVGASSALWALGRGDDDDAHYALQRWWASRLIAALQATADLELDVTGLEDLAPGPVVICSRHVSIADALLPAWLLGQVDMRPRYVLKDDLQLDPCLDIVGGRLPNHFVDRDPDNSAEELAVVEALALGMGEADAAVIFPEGTTVTEAHRVRVIERIAERDPDRLARVRDLRHLAPVRAGGTAALLRGAPDADLVILSHIGFERLNRLAEIPAGLPLTDPVRVHLTRIPRAEVPAGDALFPWLDDVWASCDRQVAAWHEERRT